MVEEKVCKLCKTETNSYVNIKLNKIPLCESCCNTITLQQVHYLLEQRNDEKRR